MNCYSTFALLLIGALILAPSQSPSSPKLQFTAQAPAASQSLQANLPRSSTDKSSWAARLSAVYTRVHLAADGTPPYRLHAHIKVFDFRHKFVEGELTYTWANWDRWRMETTWGGATRVKIVNRNRWWRSPANADVVAEQHTEERLGFSQFLKPDPKASFSSPRTRTIEGVTADCITEKWRTSEPPFRPDTPMEREICLNSSNDFPLRVKSGTLEITFGSGEYAPLGFRQFPRKFSFVESGKKTMELTLDSLETLTGIPANAFAPPEGAVSLPWCLNETRPFPVDFSGGPGVAPYIRDVLKAHRVNGPVASLGTTTDFSFVIFDVDADGRVKSLQAFSKNGEDASQKPGARSLRDSKFKPAICGTGQPIENELVWISPSD